MLEVDSRQQSSQFNSENTSIPNPILASLLLSNFCKQYEHNTVPNSLKLIEIESN